MTSSQHGPYALGHTRATVGGTEGRQPARGSRSQKTARGSDCRLQPACMKLELLVTADQHAAVNTFSDPAHIARHTPGRELPPKTALAVEVVATYRGEGAAR